MAVQGAPAIGHASECPPSSASGPLPVVSMAFWCPGIQHAAKIKATLEVQLLLGQLIVKVSPCIVCTASASILGLTRSSEEAANRYTSEQYSGMAYKELGLYNSSAVQTTLKACNCWLQHMSQV